MNPIQNMRLRRALPALTEFIVVRSLPWLAIAGVFLFLAPRAFASATITSGFGIFEGSVQFCADLPDCNNFPPDCSESDDQAIAAPIGNPGDPPAGSIALAKCSGNGGSAGPLNLSGAYTGDTRSMTLTASGSGSTSSSNSVAAFVSAENNSDILFTVTGEPTEVPISVSLAAHNCDFASATLSGPNGFIAEITADNSGQHGTFPSDPLEPGDYTISLSFDAFNPEENSSFSFSFSATIVVQASGPPIIQWNNPAGGSFQLDTNWDPEDIPGANDTAVFGLASAYSVNVGTATTERLEIRNGDVTFTNANYNVAALDFVPSGTVLDNAVLTVASGTLSGIHALIGESAAARVDVLAGATLNYTGSLQVGGPGNGILNIEDGGFAFSGEGRIGTGVGGGTAQLTGPDALWQTGSLAVGFFSGVESNLFVSGGATLLSDSGSVGFTPGSDGLVQIEGDLSTWDLNGDLKIGEGGGGDLKVLDGALVKCPFLLVGKSAPGTVLVKGAGTEPSFVDVAGTLFVGDGDLGLLELQDGAQVRVIDPILVAFDETEAATGIGVISVAGKSTAGPSLLDTLSSISLGFGGQGFLNIKEDATVICEDAFIPLFSNSSGNAVLGVDGAPGNPASWSVSNEMIIGSNGATDIGTGIGRVELHNGAIVTVGQKLTIDRTGMICGNGTYSALSVENRGTACPGNSAGTLVIGGDYTQTATGKLTIETAGLGDGEFDILHVTGDATLGGTLEMLFPGTYLPKTGDSFTFLQVDAAISGNFAEITFPQLLPGFQFDLMQVPGGFLFTALNDAVLAPTFLLNISTRLQVGTDDNVLIGGFILQGTEPKTVLIRAIGPSLEAFGVAGALANPTLDLHDSTGASVAQNDNWRTTQIGGLIAEDQFLAIFDTGLAPTSNVEAAIIATLNPGLYTAIVAGADNGTGIALVEVYDLGPAPAPAKLGNISTRGFVQTGDNVMIGGFIIGNQTSEVLVRGIGPSLIPFGIDNALADPLLELHGSNGDLLASNDNWRSDQEAEIEATDLAPGDDAESAILRTLAPGAYTAILRGVGDSIGVGLVEAYQLD